MWGFQPCFRRGLGGGDWAGQSEENRKRCLPLPNLARRCQVGLCAGASSAHHSHYQQSNTSTNSGLANIALHLLAGAVRLGSNKVLAPRKVNMSNCTRRQLNQLSVCVRAVIWTQCCVFTMISLSRFLMVFLYLSLRPSSLLTGQDGESEICLSI